MMEQATLAVILDNCTAMVCDQLTFSHIPEKINRQSTHSSQVYMHAWTNAYFNLLPHITGAQSTYNATLLCKNYDMTTAVKNQPFKNKHYQIDLFTKSKPRCKSKQIYTNVELFR